MDGIIESWRGIDKNGSQFLWRKNLEGRVMSRMKEVDLIFFYFFLSHFYFIFDLFFFILFLELGLGLE